MYLHQYIRDPDTNRKTGVVTAQLFDDTVVVSWSKCHTHLDKYDRQQCMSIALGRGQVRFDEMNGKVKLKSKEVPRIHQQVAPIVDEMVDRASHYFQQAKHHTIITHRPAFDGIKGNESIDRYYKNRQM